MWLDNSGGERFVAEDQDLKAEVFREAQLRGAHFRGANLQDCCFRNASLVDADLRECNLQRADLSGADLRDSDLRWADLREARLQGALIGGATFAGNHFSRDWVVISLSISGCVINISPEATEIGHSHFLNAAAMQLPDKVIGRKCAEARADPWNGLYAVTDLECAWFAQWAPFLRSAIYLVSQELREP